MGTLFALIPSRAKIYGLAVLAFALGILGWRKAGINVALRRERMAQTLKDYKHADEIEHRVDDSRSDADRLRKYDDSGYRQD